MITYLRFSIGFRLGRPWQGLDLLVSSTQWSTWLCGMGHYPAGKTNPQGQGTLSEQTEARLNVWFIHPSRTKICPIPALWSPPDRHCSSIKFPSGCETLWLVGLSRSPSNHWMTRMTTRKAEHWTHKRKWPYSSLLHFNPYGLKQTSAWSFFAPHWWRAFSTFALIQPCLKDSSHLLFFL